MNAIVFVLLFVTSGEAGTHVETIQAESEVHCNLLLGAVRAAEPPDPYVVACLEVSIPQPEGQ